MPDSPEGPERFDAVVVHYDNPDVVGTVQGLAEQTRRPSRVLVVDNSDSLPPDPFGPLPFPVEVVGPVGNAGYAAAVNHVRQQDPSSAEPLLLVLTHEVRLEHDAAERLVAAMAEPGVASAGPVLHRRSDPEAVFSAGGTLDGAAWPRHLLEPPAAGTIRDVAWIDGSVMMLRRSALDAAGWLDEGYFLYFEELDLAARLQRRGGRVVVVAGARARQEPGGYPPFLATRNRLLFARAFPERVRMPRVLLAARMLAEIGWVARRRGTASVGPSLRGLRAGLAGRTGRPAG